MVKINALQEKLGEFENFAKLRENSGNFNLSTSHTVIIKILPQILSALFAFFPSSGTPIP